MKRNIHELKAVQCFKSLTRHEADGRDLTRPRVSGAILDHHKSRILNVDSPVRRLCEPLGVQFGSS